MRIIHTSDWHLGRILYKKSLIEDQRFFIYDFFLPAMDELSPDAVMISGDIFDRQIAPAEAISLFDGFISELCVKRGIKLFIITGNHDGADRFALAPELLSKSGLHIASRLDLTSPPIRLDCGGEHADIYMLPYFDPARARAALDAAGYSSESITTFSDAYSAVLDIKCRNMDNSAVNILMAHCFASGASKSDSESVMYLGNAGEVPPSLFDRFDYAALGHLHGPQKSGKSGRYSGSPLKYSFDEEKQRKAIWVLDIKNNKIALREYPVKPLHDMRTVSGSIEEIESAAKLDTSQEDYIYAKIEGAPVYEPMLRLRKVYPNILDLKNGNLTAIGGSTERDELREKLMHSNGGGLSLMTEFLRQMCGYEPDEQDLSLLRELLSGADEGSI